MHAFFNFFKAVCLDCNRRVFIFLGDRVILDSGYICPYCNSRTEKEEIFESLIIGNKKKNASE